MGRDSQEKKRSLFIPAEAESGETGDVPSDCYQHHQMLAKKNVNYSYVRGLNIKTYLLYSDVFIFYCSFLSLAYKKKREACS